MNSFLAQYGPLVQTVAILISAIAAVVLIWHNGKIAKKRALIDLIIQQRMDPSLCNAYKRVYRLAEENQAFLSSYAPCNPPSKLSTEEQEEYLETREAILKVLNAQEFVAVGIRLKAFDESVYKELQCSNVRKIWKATSGFVCEVRKLNAATVFQDLEALAKKWDKNPVQVL